MTELVTLEIMMMDVGREPHGISHTLLIHWSGTHSTGEAESHFLGICDNCGHL